MISPKVTPHGIGAALLAAILLHFGILTLTPLSTISTEHPKDDLIHLTLIERGDGENEDEDEEEELADESQSPKEPSSTP